MINFDALPRELEGSVIPAGYYFGVIVNAEMKSSKTSGKQYLSLTWDVYDDNNKKVGKIFDSLHDSDNQYIQHKIYCFMTACGINLGSRFDLKDLAKVCVNRKCILNLRDKDKDGNAKNEVNIFDNPYKALEKEARPTIPTELIENEDVPFGESAMNEPIAENNDDNY